MRSFVWSVLLILSVLALLWTKSVLDQRDWPHSSPAVSITYEDGTICTYRRLSNITVKWYCEMKDGTRYTYIYRNGMVKK